MYRTRTNEFLEAVAAEIQAWLPELKTCEGHDGRFDLAELKRRALKTPAVLVSCGGTTSVEERGDEGINSTRQWTAFVLTRDAPGLSRGEAARNLVDALEFLILLGAIRTEEKTGVQRQSNRWGLRGVGQPEQLRSQNLYSGTIDKKGVALWAVSWRQTLSLRPLTEEEDCPIPSHVYLGQAPEIGTGHEADYERVS
ncbi:MAG: hypothetical protein OXI69_15530 [Acidobacteriota bacterium]|nr:hypothetical protein [Acidobacteriota bacterium]